MAFYEMSLEENRVASFENWPFQDDGQEGICTAKRVSTFRLFKHIIPVKNCLSLEMKGLTSGCRIFLIIEFFFLTAAERLKEKPLLNDRLF